MKLLFIYPLLLMLTGCVGDECFLESNNPIMTLVLQETSQKPCQCTNVVQISEAALEIWDIPNPDVNGRLMLSAKLFKSTEIQSVIEKLVNNRPVFPKASIIDVHGRVRQQTESGLCGTTYLSPLVIDEYAFVRFSQPSGYIGWLSMKKVDDSWVLIEQAHAGYW